MQASDILVHASFDEPTGTVILEGMALGKPVVAARTEGPMEFVRDGENGRLADPGNGEQLAATIGELLDNPVQRRRLGLAARERAREFGADRLAAGVGGAMLELVNQRRAYAAA
jgi:glycosyltransferase involved in cell wall biosynthesis